MTKKTKNGQKRARICENGQELPKLIKMDENVQELTRIYEN